MPCPLARTGWEVAVEAWFRSETRTYGQLDYGDEVYGAEAGTGTLEWNELTSRAVSVGVRVGDEVGSISPPVPSITAEFLDPDADIFDFATPTFFFRPTAGTPIRVRIIAPDGSSSTLATGIVESVLSEHRRGVRVATVEAFGVLSQFSAEAVAFEAPSEQWDERISRLSIEAPLSYNPSDQSGYVPPPLPSEKNEALEALPVGTVNILDEIRAASVSIGCRLVERRDGAGIFERWPIDYSPASSVVVADCRDAGEDVVANVIGYAMDLETMLNDVQVQRSDASTAPPTNAPLPDPDPPELPSATVTLPDIDVRPYHALVRTNYTVVPSSTTTKINLSTTNGVDSDGMVSTSSDEITILSSGAYLIVAQMQDTTINHNRVVTNVRVNGTTVAKDDYQSATATTVWRGATVATFRYLYAGDKVSLWMFQSSSSNQTFGTNAGYLGVAQVRPNRANPMTRTIPVVFTNPTRSATPTPASTDLVSTRRVYQESIDQYGRQSSTLGAPFRTTLTNTSAHGSLMLDFANAVLARFGGNINRPAYVDFDSRTDPRWLDTVAELDLSTSLLVKRTGIVGRPLEHRSVVSGYDLVLDSAAGLSGRVYAQTVEQTI